MEGLHTLQNSQTNQKLFCPHPLKKRFDMSCVSSIILGGGAGTRLLPLTLTRCKPAISFGGRYRLIDIPISNALNAGCNKIFVLTQFLSASLHRHIQKTYRMELHSSGFVEILSAEQKPGKNMWYQGTADAIRQNIDYLQDCEVDYFLILSGDQLYQFHFEEMVAFAENFDADVIVAAKPVDDVAARRMGILKIDEKNIVTDFLEKPPDSFSLEKLRMPIKWTKKNGVSPKENLLGSMGIYLFKKDSLLQLLKEDAREDFGKHLIPTEVKKRNVAAFIFKGYWEDVGTIESFYLANMALTEPEPSLSLHDERFPIQAVYHSLPPPRIDGSHIISSLICEGGEIKAKEISKSIIGPRLIIGEGTVIEKSYLFGNDSDHHQSDFKYHSIGKNCEIRRAIIDKHVRIGDNVRLVNQNGYTSYESENVFIRDGIIVVKQGSEIPPSFVL